MKRLGVCGLTLAFALSLWATPAGSQDKYVLGYGGGT